MADVEVSAATVDRLPLYLHASVDLAANEERIVSSERLAELVNVNPATVRRDLAALSITGRRGVGYDVSYVVYEISKVLGVNQQWPVVVGGAGNIGRALCNYEGFAERGFPVKLLLDNDPAKVGNKIGGIRVEHIDDIDTLVAAHTIEVGVIATPAAHAQSAAQKLVAAGVSSLLNFTAHTVDVTADVIVRKVDVATELQILSFYKQRTKIPGGATEPLTYDS